MKKGSSIHTIAKELGVSATTISFIINGKARDNGISEPVIKRVEAHLLRINYKPNIIAKSLRTGKSTLIGMLVEDISDSFFSAIARGVELGFENSGYKILLMSTQNRCENALAILQLLKEHKVDAFIMAPSPGLEQEVRELVEMGKPVVLFDRYFEALATCNVMIDNRRGAYMGTMELFNSGCKKTAFITLDASQVQMQDRLKGYKDALAAQNQEADNVLYVGYNINAGLVAQQISIFLKQTEVDGVLFATNYLTIAGLIALKQMNLRVSEDISVVSFDDNEHFELLTPTISAVCQPVSGISKAIVKNLQEALIHSTKCPPQTIVLSPQLIRRESTQNFALSNDSTKSIYKTNN